MAMDMSLPLYEQLKQINVARERKVNGHSPLLAYARFLNRCYCSIRREYTGNSWLRAYSESSTEFRHFLNLAKMFMARRKVTGIDVNAPGFFRAQFQAYKEAAFPARCLGEGAWYWYRRWCSTKYTKHANLSRSQKLEYHKELREYLAGIWSLTDKEAYYTFRLLFQGA